MPFDPTKPAPGDVLDAELVLAQLNSLHEEIASIPQGPPGPEGPQGPSGADGAPGAPGSPGEVTTAALNEAIAGTARNPINLAPLNITISDPPTQSEVQALLDGHNQLLAEIKRLPI